MRIHRIRLRNFRGVVDVDVTFPTEGVTIIEGDNEVGKTSLSEAIDLLLEHRDDSTKKAVRAVKPVGRDVGAEVEIDMSSGPYRFGYRKRWHRQKETVLELLEPERAHLTGREAHDRVRAILDETLDGSLWEALRLRQGTPLDPVSFAGGSLARALDIAAGGSSAGDREDDLWVRITAERERYWTALGHPKADRRALADRVAGSASAVAELETVLADLEADAEQVERLEAAAVELAEKQRRNEADLERLTARFTAIETHRHEVERLAGLRDTASARHDRAIEISKARSSLVERVALARRGVDALESTVQSALPARAQVEARRTEAQQAVGEAKDLVRHAEVAQRRAVGDSEYRRQQIELAQLSERRDRVLDAVDRQSQAEAVLEASHIDDALFERIEDAHLELAKSEAAATSAAASIDVEALADLDLRIDDATVALGVGAHHELHVTGTSRLTVPGAITMVVTAGAEAQALADRQIDAERTFRYLCEQAHVSHLAEARQALAARHDAERVLVEVATSIQQDLRDLTPEALAQKVQRLTTRVATFEAERAEEPPVPPDLDSAQSLATECDRVLEERRDELVRLDKDLAEALAAVQAVDLDDATSRARLDQAREALAQAETALDEARQDETDADVAARAAQTEDAVRACAHELAAAEAVLAAEDPVSVEELLRNARGVKKRLADERHENEVTRRDLRTRLAVRGEEGLANELDVAKSELVWVSAEHERLEARAAAAALLHDTFARRRAEAHHRYVAPFRERIEQLGRLVFGPDLEVELDDDLRIARRTLGGITLDFADLSAGAQEQLGMISRLACASIVAADGGAPVIFDDALGWTDPGKLGRMGAVISTAGRSCQIIVLTCSPGRYESVGNAGVVRLPG
jgi:chromosome segregation ATPase